MNKFHSGNSMQQKEPKKMNRNKTNSNYNSLVPINKNFYIQHPNVINRNNNYINEFISINNINTRGTDIPRPIINFEEGNFSDYVLKNIRDKKYKLPTAIQAQSIPVALCGRHLIGISKENSGKTVSYILAMIDHIHHQHPLKKGEGPIALVIAPTQAIASSIHLLVKEFIKGGPLRSALLCPAEPALVQIANFKLGVEIIVTSPGRLFQFIGTVNINLDRCSMLIIDDCINFLSKQDQILKIFSLTRPDRQILIYSSIWSKKIETTLKSHLNDYIEINIHGCPNHNIQQSIEMVLKSKSQSCFKLFKRIFKNENAKVIIFASTQVRINSLKESLTSFGKNISTIITKSSDSYKQLRAFQSNKTQILLVRDSTFADIDFSETNYIINYDYPMTINLYLRRIERIASTNCNASVYTLVSTEDFPRVGDLYAYLRETNQLIPTFFARYVENLGDNETKAGTTKPPTRDVFISKSNSTSVCISNFQSNSSNEDMRDNIDSQSIKSHISTNKREMVPAFKHIDEDNDYKTNNYSNVIKKDHFEGRDLENEEICFMRLSQSDEISLEMQAKRNEKLLTQDNKRSRTSDIDDDIYYSKRFRYEDNEMIISNFSDNSHIEKNNHDVIISKVYKKNIPNRILKRNSFIPGSPNYDSNPFSYRISSSENKLDPRYSSPRDYDNDKDHENFRQHFLKERELYHTRDPKTSRLEAFGDDQMENQINNDRSMNHFKRLGRNQDVFKSFENSEEELRFSNERQMMDENENRSISRSDRFDHMTPDHQSCLLESQMDHYRSSQTSENQICLSRRSSEINSGPHFLPQSPEHHQPQGSRKYQKDLHILENQIGSQRFSCLSIEKQMTSSYYHTQETQKRHRSRRSPDRRMDYQSRQTPDRRMDFQRRQTPDRQIDFESHQTPDRQMDFQSRRTPNRQMDYQNRPSPDKQMDFQSGRTSNRRIDHRIRRTPNREMDFQRRHTPNRQMDFQRRHTPNRQMDFQCRQTPDRQMDFQSRQTPNRQMDFQSRQTPDRQMDFQSRQTPDRQIDFQRRHTPNRQMDFQSRQTPDRQMDFQSRQTPNRQMDFQSRQTPDRQMDFQSRQTPDRQIDFQSCQTPDRQIDFQSRQTPDRQIDFQSRPSPDKQISYRSRRSPDKQIPYRSRRSPDRQTRYRSRRSPDRQMRYRSRRSSDRRMDYQSRRTPDRQMDYQSRRTPDRQIDYQSRRTPDRQMDYQSRRTPDRQIDYHSRRTPDRQIDYQSRRTPDRQIDFQSRRTPDRQMDFRIRQTPDRQMDYRSQPTPDRQMDFRIRQTPDRQMDYRSQPTPDRQMHYRSRQSPDSQLDNLSRRSPDSQRDNRSRRSPDSQRDNRSRRSPDSQRDNRSRRSPDSQRDYRSRRSPDRLMHYRSRRTPDRPIVHRIRQSPNKRMDFRRRQTPDRPMNYRIQRTPNRQIVHRI